MINILINKAMKSINDNMCNESNNEILMIIIVIYII